MRVTSGFKKKKHSTKTARIKIIDELLFNLDKDRVSGMVLQSTPDNSNPR